ncbi:MAG TPA: ComEA family DNA-binding protein [Candidatus Binatia bacterium]|nr:ComEA family DNA-binding protein [Candidatus Binatia bacterium]
MRCAPAGSTQVRAARGSCGVALRAARAIAAAALAAAIALGAPAAAPAAGEVDLNAATAEELASLPGIGPSKARAIVAYREATPFRSVDDLRQVKGIGDRLLEDLRGKLTVSGGGDKAGAAHGAGASHAGGGAGTGSQKAAGGARAVERGAGS